MSLPAKSKNEKDADKSKDAKPEVKAEKKEAPKKPDLSALRDAPSRLLDTHIHAIGQYYLDLYPEPSKPWEIKKHNQQLVAQEFVKYSNPKGEPLDRWLDLLKLFGKAYDSTKLPELCIEAFKLSFKNLKDEDFTGTKEVVLLKLDDAIKTYYLNQARENGFFKNKPAEAVASYRAAVISKM